MQIFQCGYVCNSSGEDIKDAADICLPRNLGNGRCDADCHNARCLADYGDCVQLCFSPYTECSWDLYSNDVCDSECDVAYCSLYWTNSDFGRKNLNLIAQPQIRDQTLNF